MEQESVRWNITVSKKTDVSVRTFLRTQGARRGDLSKFIEEAVRWRVFHFKVRSIKERNAQADPDELRGIIFGAVRDRPRRTLGQKEGQQRLMRFVVNTNITNILISAPSARPYGRLLMALSEAGNRPGGLLY